MPNRLPDDFPDIANSFCVGEAYLDAAPYGSGHIHDSYAVRYLGDEGSVSRVLMQRINTQVFSEPYLLMTNIAAVTAHIQAGLEDPRATLAIIPTNEGASLLETRGGNFWRAYRFIENTFSVDGVQSPEQAFEAGKVIGQFQDAVSTLPANILHETIRDFHHTPKRLVALVEAADQDKVKRAQAASAEIAFIMERTGEIPLLTDHLENGLIPTRITHNDTKINNVLFDTRSHQGLGLVDLDTVMPGSALFDFGDAVRFGTNTAEEDEQDLSKVHFDIHLYEQFARGYLLSAKGFLTDLEKSLLPAAARLMTLECAIRFLADYLSGDIYFKVSREHHNLDRARNQLKLLEEMEKADENMQKIAERYA